MSARAPRTTKKTATDRRRRAAQRDILGGTLSSIANGLEAQLTALQTHLALDHATLTPRERRALGKLASQLTLVSRYLRILGKGMSRNRDTREQQAQWNGDSNGR